MAPPAHDILFLDGQAGALFNEGTARRTLSAQDVATNGDVTGHGFGASARGGIRLNVSGWNIEPSVMLSGLSLHQDGLTETGGGPVGVAVNSNSIASVQDAGRRAGGPSIRDQRDLCSRAVGASWLGL